MQIFRRHPCFQEAEFLLRFGLIVMCLNANPLWINPFPSLAWVLCLLRSTASWLASHQFSRRCVCEGWGAFHRFAAIRGFRCSATKIAEDLGNAQPARVLREGLKAGARTRHMDFAEVVLWIFPALPVFWDFKARHGTRIICFESPSARRSFVQAYRITLFWIAICPAVNCSGRFLIGSLGFSHAFMVFRFTSSSPAVSSTERKVEQAWAMLHHCQLGCTWLNICFGAPLSQFWQTSMWWADSAPLLYRFALVFNSHAAFRFVVLHAQGFGLLANGLWAVCVGLEPIGFETCFLRQWALLGPTLADWF